MHACKQRGKRSRGNCLFLFLGASLVVCLGSSVALKSGMTATTTSVLYCTTDPDHDGDDDHVGHDDGVLTLAHLPEIYGSP